METGVRHHAIETENFTDNRHSYVQARIGAQGGKHDTKEAVREMNQKMEVATSGKCIDKTKGRIRQPVMTTTGFNKTIATATIRCMGTAAIVV